MENIFDFVLITSLYGSIVGIIIILLKVILKNKLTPQWHYLIWMILILKLLIPFGPESNLSLFNVVPAPQTSIIEPVLPAGPRYEIPKQVEKEPGNVPSSQPTLEVKPLPSGKVFLFKDLVPFAWAVGALCMMFWMILVYYQIHEKLGKSRYPMNKELLAVFEDCKKKMKINKNITLVIQNVIKSPSLYGFINPRILLTPEVASLSQKEIKYILLHELAHYKRKDILVNYILLVFQVIHWFNPVMWYCFKLIRQDMEVATDERVLVILEQTEHKDYGRALISILEGFSTPNLVPRMLGMADDKENIKRRLRMIKMAEIFKSKRSITIIIGMICILTLGGALLTSGRGGINRDSYPKHDSQMKYNAEELYKHKSLYIGDASNVSNLLNKLPLGNYKTGLSLETSSKPYGLTVNFNFSDANIGSSPLEMEELSANLRKNAVIVFALIENVEEITFTGNITVYLYSRTEMQKEFSNNLWDYSKDIDTFKGFINEYIEPLSQKPKDLEMAISEAIKDRGKIYYGGEFLTQGHIIIDTDEKGDTVKVYTLASVG